MAWRAATVLRSSLACFSLAFRSFGFSSLVASLKATASSLVSSEGLGCCAPLHEAACFISAVDQTQSKAAWQAGSPIMVVVAGAYHEGAD